MNRQTINNYITVMILIGGFTLGWWLAGAKAHAQERVPENPVTMWRVADVPMRGGVGIMSLSVVETPGACVYILDGSREALTAIPKTALASGKGC